MARYRFLISLALALAIHALALLVVELMIRNQRARLPEYSGPLFVLLEEVPVIARSLPAAREAAEEPPPAESGRAAPAAAPPEAAPPAPGGAAPGVRAADVVKPAPRETVTAPAVPEAAPPPVRRSEPFVPEEVVIPPAGRGEAAETPGAAGQEAAPPSGGQAPAAGELTELDSALRERREADAAASADAAGEPAGGTAESAARETAAEAAGDGFEIQWEDPTQGREAVSRPLPVLPAWVSKEGQRLRITVGFVLTPQGFLDEVKTVVSSGYTDVDAAVEEALRKWKFKPVAGTRSVRGMVTYRIEPR